jgi:hypothetical protein
MNKVFMHKLFYFYLLILSITLSFGYSQSATVSWTQPVNGLRLGIFTPTPNYGDPETFKLSLLFENLGKEKISVLSQSIRRNYQSKGQGTAKYVPFPGPRISPWKDIFTLLPGQRNEIKLVGMRDGDGIWVLEPGTYDLSIWYVVPQDLVSAYARDFPESKTELWTGDIESGRLIIKFQP